MDERLALSISKLSSWKEIATFEKNVSERGRLTPDVVAALHERAESLARIHISMKTGLPLTDLSEAEEKIVGVVSEYVAIKKAQGRNAEYTLRQLANHGLIGAAETAVSRNTPTQGFKTLAEEDREDLSYEQIIIDHPDEFSPRALWFSRRTLGLENETNVPPTDIGGKVQTRTETLLGWLQGRAEAGNGRIANYSNAEAARIMGLEDTQRFGRVHGNIQSRLDYACYKSGVPPLGMTAEAPFAEAWGQGNRTWAYPKESMQRAAQAKVWTPADFALLRHLTEALPGQAYHLWNKAATEEEGELRSWAFGLGAPEIAPAQFDGDHQEPPRRNPPWSRDELILALDLYLRNRVSPPAKDSAEVAELSAFLEQMGRALGQVSSENYRNANGVYMKMMNFRRFDPDFTRDGRVGLQRGGKDEERVWAEFALDPVRLRAVAGAIRQAIKEDDGHLELAGVDEPDIVEAAEGRTLTRLHRVKERSRKLIEEKKRQALKVHGRLFCDACGFCFADRYGDEAAAIIDCHHTRPVHTLVEGDITKLDDLALLCANCHRVVHSRKQWLSIDELRRRLRTS